MAKAPTTSGWPCASTTAPPDMLDTLPIPPSAIRPPRVPHPAEPAAQSRAAPGRPRRLLALLRRGLGRRAGEFREPPVLSALQPVPVLDRDHDQPRAAPKPAGHRGALWRYRQG